MDRGLTPVALSCPQPISSARNGSSTGFVIGHEPPATTPLHGRCRPEAGRGPGTAAVSEAVMFRGANACPDGERTGGSVLVLLPDPELLEPLVERLRRDLQQLDGLAAVAAGEAQGVLDVPALRLFHHVAQ